MLKNTKVPQIKGTFLKQGWDEWLDRNEGTKQSKVGVWNVQVLGLQKLL